MQLAAGLKPLLVRFLCTLVLLRYVLPRLVGYYIRRHILASHNALPLPSFESNFDVDALGLLGSTGATVLERVNAFKRFPNNTLVYKEALFGLASTVVTINPEHMSELTKLEKSARINVISNFVGKQSVAFQVGGRGKRDRQRLNVAFATERLEEELFPAMRVGAGRLAERLANSSEFDPAVEFSRTTFEVITEASFGMAVDEAKDDFLTMVSMALNPVVFLPFGVPMVKWYYAKTLKSIQTMLEYIFAHRRRQLLEKDANAKQDLLHVMMALEGDTIEGVPKQEWVEDNLKSFLFAGTDTSACALQYCTALLANRPECQAKLRQELTQVVGVGPNAVVEFHHLDQLVYLNGVIKETLRLYPPALGVARTTQNTEVDGIPLPDGITFMLDILNMHRRADFFSNPHEFVPERWIPGASKETCNEQGFMPFSRGFRSCIGQKFAVMELKTVLAMLFVGGKEIKPVGPIPMWPDGVLFKGTPAPPQPVQMSLA